MARLQLGLALTVLCLVFLFLYGAELRSSWAVNHSTGRRSWSTCLQGFFPGYELRSGHGRLYSRQSGDRFLLGVGKADITGPSVEVNFMGYANPSQVGSGLRQRLYSRAFIVGDIQSPFDRYIYLVLDTQSGDTTIRYGIMEGLAALGPDYAVYGQSNVAVTGTHSHSGPGAWLNYLLPQITSKGFSKQSYDAIVQGALLSIRRAHASLSPGYLAYGSTRVSDANINRSLYAYLANPSEEREIYEDNVDKNMTVLRLQRQKDGKFIGVLNWFPVHGTSMLGNNTLVTGDNKGVAAYLFEKSVASDSKYAENFVAGFSQSNVGDTTPNILGAWCEDGSGLECDFQDSTCGGKAGPCHGRGPFFREKDLGTKSCFEIGKRQFEAARHLSDSLDEVGTPVRGPTVKHLHTFVDFSNFTFTLPNGTQTSTCSAALGYSFAAGTSDWPGAFDFKQNDPDKPDANPLWAVVGGFLHKPSDSQKKCQSPKPILLDVGEAKTPYAWTPNIVDIQLFRVGQFITIVSPGEATTMSGRRWRAAIKEGAENLGLAEVEPAVVLGGPANSYTHYIATEEEYGIQRYEGASTLYGPNTLNAYINLTVSYLPYLQRSSNERPPPGPPPPNNVNRSLSFITGVVYDNPPIFKSFGDITQDVASSYRTGDIARARFVGANPRNNLRLEDTYAAVERRTTDGSWTRIHDDQDWTLVFRWKSTNGLTGTSEVTIEWEIEGQISGSYRSSVKPLTPHHLYHSMTWLIKDAQIAAGVYRLHYYGDSKAPITGRISSFEGVSSEFAIVNMNPLDLRG